CIHPLRRLDKYELYLPEGVRTHSRSQHLNCHITRGRVFLPASYKIVVMLRDFLFESARLGNQSPSLADS
ncbi:hypothetical protein, partial [Allocoleopsis sp.]|uniref:hypothetical protein n=1 Tax=Allocoleopsis sp. TaxID=3088169 RepID=UPI002FD2C177